MSTKKQLRRERQKKKQEEVAKTGDAVKRALLAEYTLVSRNEAASGVIAALIHSYPIEDTQPYVLPNNQVERQ